MNDNMFYWFMAAMLAFQIGGWLFLGRVQAIHDITQEWWKVILTNRSEWTKFKTFLDAYPLKDMIFKFWIPVKFYEKAWEDFIYDISHE